MTAFIALLRAVNVSGTGKLPMTELKAMCDAAGFNKARTYIASGNVVFESGRSEAAVKTALETSLERYAGKPVGVVVRTVAELTAVADANPFPHAAPNRSMVLFLDTRPPYDALQKAKHHGDEELALGVREIYVHYPSGQGGTKLIIPAARAGTMRNMNTVRKLIELATAL